MEDRKITVGGYISINHLGFGIARVRAVRGNELTVVLYPWQFKGEKAGKRVRIRKDKIYGLVYRKKVIPWHG